MATNLGLAFGALIWCLNIFLVFRFLKYQTLRWHGMVGFEIRKFMPTIAVDSVDVSCGTHNSAAA